ncbi:MAG: NAD(P)-dependent alcohol dehydrogenase [Devosia sp.]
MRAAVYEIYGPPEVVTIRTVPKPTPKQNEVLVKVHTTLVTSGDARLRAFDIPALFRIPGRLMLGWPKPREQILGFCFSGVVDSIGTGVTAFKIGDEVLGGRVNGTHAQYAAVPADKGIVPKPPNLSFEAAATVAFGPNTALTFLRNSRVGPDTRLLIIGASGSVGAYALQISRHLGADISAVCSGANAELVTSLGASRVIDYAKQDIRKLGETFDVVFDTVGTMSFVEALPLLAKHGTFATAVMSPADIWPMLWPPARKGRKIVGGQAEATNDKMSHLAEMMSAGTLQSVIDSRYTLDTIRDAHARVDSKRKRGDVVVAVT